MAGMASSVGKVIYQTLRLGTSAIKPYPEIASQDIPTNTEEYVTYRTTGVTPSDTKDGTSRIDEVDVDVFIYANNHENLVSLAETVRADLDRSTRTNVGTVLIDGIQYQGERSDYDYDTKRYVIEQTYTIRLKRNDSGGSGQGGGGR